MGGGCAIMGAFSSGGGGVTTNALTAALSAERTTTSTSFEDITDLEIELSDESGGIATIISNNSVNASDNAKNMHVAIGDDGSAIAATAIEAQRAGGTHTSISTSWVMSTDGSTITCMGMTQSGVTMTFQYATNVSCQIIASEVY